MANDVPRVPTEWYHRRFQAVGRAQSRYFLLCLLVSVYTFGLSFKSDATVSVAILGLPDVPKEIVNAAATVVLLVLLLALFGSLQAAREAGDELRARLSDDGVTQVPWHVFDEHPNVADLLGYATYVDGKPRVNKLTRLEVLVLYPLPVLAFVLWTGLLWWRGVSAGAWAPDWLAWIYRVAVLLMLAVLWATVVFMRRRWELFRTRASR